MLIGTPEVVADPGNNVEAVAEVPADSYEEGINKIRKGIVLIKQCHV